MLKKILKIIKKLMILLKIYKIKLIIWSSKNKIKLILS